MRINSYDSKKMYYDGFYKALEDVERRRSQITNRYDTIYHTWVTYDNHDIEKEYFDELSVLLNDIDFDNYDIWEMVKFNFPDIEKRHEYRIIIKKNDYATD